MYIRALEILFKVDLIAKFLYFYYVLFLHVLHYDVTPDDDLEAFSAQLFYANGKLADLLK